MASCMYMYLATSFLILRYVLNAVFKKRACYPKKYKRNDKVCFLLHYGLITYMFMECESLKN